MALEGVDNSGDGILWPADIATIPGTDSNSLRFKLEILVFLCEKTFAGGSLRT